MKVKIKLLVIEDENAIRDMIRFSLPQEEFDFSEAENVGQAIQLLGDRIPDLILLDWMLPGRSGIDFIKWIKQQENLKDIPIIMLTAKAEEESKVKGLKAGADDYITKPFSIAELIARIKTVLRRGPLVCPEGTVKIGELCLNTNTHKVRINQKLLELTPTEYNLLHFFLTHQNRTYTRDQIITQVWGPAVYIDERTIDVQIRRLRDRLKPFNYDKLIQTIRGTGYQFVTKSI